MKDNVFLKRFLLYTFSLIFILGVIIVMIIFSIDCSTGICDGPGLAILILFFVLIIAVIYSIIYWIWIKKLVKKDV